MQTLLLWEAMFALMVTWFLWALAFVGLGSLILRLFHQNLTAPRNLTWAFWLGLSLTAAFLQLWHLAFPIDARATLVIFASGMLLALPLLAPAIRSLCRIPHRQLVAVATMALTLTVLFANRATGPETFYDSGLYHHQALLWAQTYPIVPGLANLHYRLGFNSAITLLAAMMDQYPWHGQVSHLLNGFFLAALALMIAAAAARVLFQRNVRPADVFTLFLTLPLCDWAMDVQASSLSTDLPTAIICLAAAVAFLEFHADFVVRQFRLFRLVTLVVLCSLAAVCKGAALPLAACLIVLAFARFAMPRSAATIFHKQRTLVALGIAFVALPGVWMVNNVISSGYPLFPSDLGAVAVDWQMPRQHVQQIRAITRDWNTWESFDSTLGHFRWVIPWFKLRILPIDFIFKALLPMLVAVVSLFFTIFRRQKAAPPPGASALSIACLAAIVVWFFNAPAPRLGSQYFQILSAVAMMTLALAYSGASGVSRRRIIFVAAFWMLLPPLAYGIFYRSSQGLMATFWIPPPKDSSMGGLHPAPLHAALRTSQTRSGLLIWLPDQIPGQDDYGDRVWDDAPLPSTPPSEFTPDLHLRDAQSMARGFTLQYPSAAPHP